MTGLWEALLASGGLILLDGAVGTELARRGVAVNGPVWSATAIVEAPGVLAAIHREYVSAGAQVVTANTFRTHPRSLARIGWETRAGELTRHAVRIARESAAPGTVIAGSLAPLEDCYQPALTPDNDALEREHAVAADHLARAGVDVILVETQHTLREALAAGSAARNTGCPFVVSFVCGPDGRLLSGEPLDEAAPTVCRLAPAAVLVNCVAAVEAQELVECLARSALGRPFGVYANVDRRTPDGRWEPTAARTPALYAALAQTWKNSGATLIGGCCGTTPAHIAAVRDLLRGSTERPD